MITLLINKPINSQTLDELYKSIDELNYLGIYPTKLTKVIREIKKRESAMKAELLKLKEENNF